MTGTRSDRLAPSRVALVVALTLGISACGADGQPETTSISTPANVGTIPGDHGLSGAQVAKILPSTVGISGVACGRLATGSGFAISDELVVTNAHVILGIDEIRVHTFDGDELTAEAVGFDAAADLALLEVPGAAFSPLALAVSANDGATGLLVGWEPAPFPDPTPFRIDRRVTVRIEAVGTTDRVDRKSWILAAELEAGDSGAALIDQAGEVVGVAFAASKQDTGVGYAVRSSEVEVLVGKGRDPNLIVPGCGE